MKKRLISILLTVLMIMSLFSGMSLSAYADNTTVTTADTIKYTMVEGDYVLRICQRLGLNYYTCKQAIMALNNINDNQWNKLPIGKVLTLPASDADALLISTGRAVTGVSTTTPVTTTTTPTTTSPTSTTVVNQISNDPVAYYLIPYTMSNGETVSGACNNLGVNFSAYSDLIMKVNDISSWKKVKAGDTILLPYAKVPSVGTNCYAVLAHKVASGETAYTIANGNGVNYNGMSKFLKALNNSDNLASIQAGQNFYYPLATTITASNDTGKAVSSESSSTNPTGKAEDATKGASTTTTPSGTVSKSYKLTSNISSAIGTIGFYVDNKTVTSAPAGVPVTVQLTLKDGTAIESLVVKHADGSADLKLTGDTFIMPACDVRVDVNIKNGHAINIKANYPTLAVTTVGGVPVTSAVKGSSVMISSLDPTYSVTEAYVSYKAMMGEKKEQVTNLSQGFVMPDADVTVEVTLKPVATYAFVVADAVNGSFFLSVNNSRVTRAARGAEVTIVASPAKGYEPKIKTLKRVDNGESVSYFNNSFTMPASDVEVELEFVSKGNNIILNPVEGGTFYAALKATDPVTAAVDEAATGSTVYILADSITTGYTESANMNDYVVTRNTDGLKVKVEKKDGKPSFTMPAGGVTITGALTSTAVTIKGSVFLDGVAVTKYSDASLFVKAHNERAEYKLGADTTTFASNFGEYVEVTYECADSLSFVTYEVEVGGTKDDELTNQANINGYFQVPNNANVTVKAYFESGKVKLGPATIIGSGSVSFELDGKSVGSCTPGEKNLSLILHPGDFYTFDDLDAATPAFAQLAKKLKVARKDTGAIVSVGTPTVITAADGSKQVKVPIFADGVPAEGLTVEATFDPKMYRIKMQTKDEKGNDLTGKGLWQISVNMDADIVDNGVTDVEASYYDGVVVSMTKAGLENYDMMSFKINGYEYVSEVINESYNFRICDLRALYDPIDIVATLRPKTNTVQRRLSAEYDSSKGSVEFLILESPSGYSNDKLYSVTGQYVKNAVAGDKVAIVVNSNSDKFSPDVDSIKVYGDDATVIVPVADTTVIAGKTVYTFVMPTTGCTIRVDFLAVSHKLTVKVFESDGTTPVTDAYVKVSLNGSTEYNDIVADTTFPDVGYKNTVRVVRTDFARAEGYKIKSIEVATAPYAEVTDGYQFTMPDADVEVKVIIDEDMSLRPVSLSGSLAHGGLKFLDAAGLVIVDAKPGDTVKVYATSDVGYEQLKDGDLKVLKRYDETSIGTWDTDHWEFVMPEGGVKFDASFKMVDYKVALNVNNGSKQIQVSFNGGTAKYVTDGDELKVNYGDSVSFYPISPEKLDSANITITSGKATKSGSTIKIGDNDASPTINVKVDITVP